VLVTVSESSKRDIAAHYGLHEDKIAVVYNGVNEVYGEQAGVEQTEIRKRYSNGQPFLLFVGSLHERKNIQRMLLAFEDFKERTRSPLHFIIAGKKMWWTSAMEATLNGLKHRNAIHFTGRIDPVETLRDVVAAAEAMIYVPTFEGFGVPVVEAQLAGVPVITSNVSSLPEAAGEGALLCDPYSVTAISDAMETITSNATLREELLIKGKANARRYDWDQSAINLWECILKATK
jgi:glycosyltransferase involved in cell wall biosynthesis